MSDTALALIADEVLALRGEPREVAPYTTRYPGYELADAYRVVREVRRRREARGERVIGRKIGFTNAAAWAGYGISGPIWNYLYDTTTLDLGTAVDYPVEGWPNVRMETEIAFGLSAAPRPGLSEEQLLACVEWVALDFEICTSAFPEWRFDVADAATTGVHVALLLGPRHFLKKDRAVWVTALGSFAATLSEIGGASADGGGAQVLGSPLKAFGYLIREMARHGGQPLVAGDIVTTGTLTRALPATSGQEWRAEVDTLPLGAVSVRLT